MNYSRTSATTLTGTVLIVAPLLALGLKTFSFGWLMVMVMFGPVVALIIGYILQIIIASQGFLSKRALFSVEGKRATIAAWLTSAAVILVGLFVVDGGDIGYGSTVQVWLGVYGENGEAVHQATDALSEGISMVALIVWLLAWLWLVIEWIIALSKRSRARRAG